MGASAGVPAAWSAAARWPAGTPSGPGQAARGGTGTGGGRPPSTPPCIPGGATVLPRRYQAATSLGKPGVCKGSPEISLGSGRYFVVAAFTSVEQITHAAVSLGDG